MRAHALRWFREYLCREHPLLGRAGDVCPFVEPALHAGTLLLRVRRMEGPATASRLVHLVHDLVRSFREAEWPHRNRTLHALVAVLPDLPEEQLRLLDEVQAAVKPELAEDGLMLGQFHARCPEPAARNPEFPVSRAPVPMLALRHMALHDILFLHDDVRTFTAYRDRFGHRYRPGVALDPLFVELFTAARRRFTGPVPAPAPAG
ncbi:heptaprenyl diphosphate synthase [Amycolatopsis arida]|uniref:Heptaprenyl diphosphate synthase n=1 Tax=Amycolatopsis arida TaxID=587909 RepID=A0A1I5LW30_9PSEU|nr:hypothetical protein CLV69_104328 [Amycolatopsis arida]SFP01442.1 heptaprenyl diphosphate synthase [Amycolatopsis arida]